MLGRTRMLADAGHDAGHLRTTQGRDHAITSWSLDFCGYDRVFAVLGCATDGCSVWLDRIVQPTDNLHAFPSKDNSAPFLVVFPGRFEGPALGRCDSSIRFNVPLVFERHLRYFNRPFPQKREVLGFVSTTQR